MRPSQRKWYEDFYNMLDILDSREAINSQSITKKLQELYQHSTSPQQKKEVRSMYDFYKQHRWNNDNPGPKYLEDMIKRLLLVSNHPEQLKPDPEHVSVRQRQPSRETPPTLWREVSDQSKDMTRTKILQFVNEELDALKKTYMFVHALTPEKAFQLYGPINYWMFSNVIYNIISQNPPHQDKIRLYLIAQWIYQQIFNSWKTNDHMWNPRLKKIVKNNYNKLWHILRGVDFESVLEYLINMETYESTATLTDKEKRFLTNIKVSALYPLLFTRFRSEFVSDEKVKDSDSETIKTIKKKLHKYRCSIFPDWLCTILKSRKFRDDQIIDMLNKLLKQGDLKQRNGGRTLKPRPDGEKIATDLMTIFDNRHYVMFERG